VIYDIVRLGSLKDLGGASRV